MYFDDERVAFEKRLNDNWGAKTPVKYENAVFEVPQGENWIGIFIRPAPAKPITIGPSPLLRVQGVLYVQVFTTKDSGTAVARQLADDVSNIFLMKEFSYGNSGRIQCYAPTIHQSEVKDGWYQLTLKIPYIRDVQSPS